MTMFYINKKEIKIKTDSETTVEAVLDDIYNDVLADDEIITNINLDGRDLTIEDEDEFLKKKTTVFKNVNFEKRNKKYLSEEALDSCSVYLNYIVQKIKDCVSIYNENKTASANKVLIEVIDILDLFIQLMSKIKNDIIANGSNSEEIKKYESSENKLAEILGGILLAQEKKDQTLLCDLLEYELIDCLDHWDKKLIPKMKSLL